MSRTNSRSRTSACLIACLAIGALSDLAPGHEFWLRAVPERQDPAADAGGRIHEIEAYVGEGLVAESLPGFHLRAEEMRLHPVTGVHWRLPSQGHGWPSVRVPSEGGVVSFLSTFSTSLLDAEAFHDYLREDGLEQVVDARQRLQEQDEPGRERYRRCAKVWIDGSEPTYLLEPTGLPLEIVPIELPSVGVETGFRILHGGEPIEGLLVRVWHRARIFEPGSEPDAASVPVFADRSDENGEVRYLLDEDGEWLVAGVHMIRSETPGFDWESTWASLAFTLP